MIKQAAEAISQRGAHPQPARSRPPTAARVPGPAEIKLADTEIEVAAIRSLATMVTGQLVDEVVADPGALARRLVGDSQIRWLGPAKGVVHMAAGGLVNAVWDLAARRAGQPLWKLLAALSPEQVVAQIDWRYLRDALTEDEALALLRHAAGGRAERERILLDEGYPAYTTTPGWLGYDDEKLARLCAQAVGDGYRLIKLKVGADLRDDVRRLAIARREVGPDVRIAVDANQIWGVPEAIDWMRWRRSTRTGSRSRHHRTTSSGTPRSARHWPR
ncbi:hypothetical protein Ato02nite_018480 [Paractinoplanes toevensis]|uniref:Mandelate racemase/muconate lactonizing enzyme C-terminal domain-containing protein n=1 Tax=Paractinoplanes toevensis TaxID=571911 RepID=A0A919T8Y5_9ACTN|nr:hypothetical protein Ato02nite_018480 [Actinoplanes toevensis]